MALNSVRSHKFRSFLTVLGIVIGIITAIVIASLLTGMRQSIISIVEEYGTNNIYAFHLSTGPRVNSDRAERLRKPFIVEDAEAIKQRSPKSRISPSSLLTWVTLVVRSTTTSVTRAELSLGQHLQA